MNWFVYILICSDEKTYVGCTGDLEDRLISHGKGQVEFTKSGLPINLITYTVFTDKYLEYHFEKYLKSGSGRAFMHKRLLNKKI
jgi:predicted GIY-YIG superfamily endonuclease